VIQMSRENETDGGSKEGKRDGGNEGGEVRRREKEERQRDT